MSRVEIGPAVSVTVVPRRLVLARRGDTGLLRVRAHSAAGFAVPLTAADVSVDYDGRLVSIAAIAAQPRAVTRTDDVAIEDWRLTALSDDVATHIGFAAGDVTAGAVVTIGSRTEQLAGAEADWGLRTARATGRIYGGKTGGDDARAANEHDTREPSRAHPDSTTRDRDGLTQVAARPRSPDRSPWGGTGRPGRGVDEHRRDHADPSPGGRGGASPHPAVAQQPHGGDRPAGPFVELEYDFTRSTATRAVYADLVRPVPVGGQPTGLSVRIDADGFGAWPSLDCRDADGTHVVLRGDHLTWRGPRRCWMPVPSAVTYPLTLHGFYLAEARPDQRYRGRIGFGDITAEVPPSADLPTDADIDLPFPVRYPPYDEPALPPPAIRPCGDRLDTEPDRPLFTNDVTDRAWRFAVLSDTQFVAARPGDALVTAARSMLRDIAAARPDLVLVDGDFVDEGSPADLALARRILDEELAGGPPWVYVPGNHEIAGGDVATFAAEFGPARRIFDHRGVRFLTLDTSSLRIGGKQLAWLRAGLERAAVAADVEAVVVAGHVPPHDPTGHEASRLVDRDEAVALEKTLAGFAATGKGCAYIAGHAGAFAAWLRDGVVYVVNGNSGKVPAAPPRRGGLLGWSECGVGPVRQWSGRAQLLHRAPDWLTVRVRRPWRT